MNFHGIAFVGLAVCGVLTAAVGWWWCEVSGDHPSAVATWRFGIWMAVGCAMVSVLFGLAG